MDAAHVSSTSSRGSGIPRISKLPVLNKRPSQAALSRRDEPASNPADHPRPRLQKRSSIASFSRSTSSLTNVGLRETAPSKATATTPVSVLTQSSQISTGPRIAPRPSSRGNQQRRPPSRRKQVLAAEDEENHDQLSSLDSFRSASRQGFLDESPTDPPPDLPPFGAPAKHHKPSRSSLSDRTVESLQNVPTTPKGRRRSSFFSPVESPMGPPPRPASSLSRNGSDRSSRPGTSDGSFAAAVGKPSVSKPTSSSARRETRASLGGFGFTPRASSRIPSASKPSIVGDQAPPLPRSPSPSKRATPTARPNGKVNGSKTIAGRTPKPRPALSDAFGPAVEIDHQNSRSNVGQESRQSTGLPPPTSRRAVSNPSNSSSAALRQQIAAAKAAARKEKAKHDSPQDGHFGDSNSIDLSADPVDQAPPDRKHTLRNRITTARMDGKLNIAALGLKVIPDAVTKMYDTAAMEDGNITWAEVVDLTRLNAADNEIEEIDDNIFPDISVEDIAAEEDAAGNQFGGLENLDLHGNRLSALPVGLRRLERLTVVNLSHNKLENGTLDVISQISSLRDLRLGHNALTGSLPASICSLQYLETLDIQANRLLALPEAIRELVRLRVINVSGNQLTALPMEALQELKLTDLDASSNALIGPLFPPGTKSAHATLQSLNVSHNSLAALTFVESLGLPQLRTLTCTNNHLTSLPDISQWKELITLMAGENKITELPQGFTSLRKLRNVNFASNAIRLVEPEIGNMESLEGLVLASNPLRDKKFLTMNAQDIKRGLRARLEPNDAVNIEDSSLQSHSRASDTPNHATSSPPTTWTLTPNALLDLSSKALSDSINDTLGAFLQSHEVRHLDLSANNLTAVPPALWLAQDLRTLDLSGNTLGSDYLSDELELPVLQELRLGRCSITTLEPLLTQLQAPQLHTLDITANRLTGPVPTLRAVYPAVTTLFAGDNKFSAVSVDALRGLQTVNLQSNDLEQLPAEIGLLWDEGLRSLEVGSNAFRVPNYRVLEKGTEVVMKWLRNRIPGVGEQ